MGKRGPMRTAIVSMSVLMSNGGGWADHCACSERVFFECRDWPFEARAYAHRHCFNECFNEYLSIYGPTTTRVASGPFKRVQRLALRSEGLRAPPFFNECFNEIF